tara:strand:+ start:622 stop:1065 length:444 start_codon:yes stop_codon:yes gene_type:complete
MIVLLRELLEENNDNMPFIESMKDQMVALYQQLSSCPDIPLNLFLHIVRKELVFVDVNEQNEIRGAFTLLLEQKVLRKGGMVAHIEDVVVSEKYRNQNIGKKLIEHAIMVSREYKCYKVILNCNDGVQGFYEKCGFKSKNKEMSLYF